MYIYNVFIVYIYNIVRTSEYTHYKSMRLISYVHVTYDMILPYHKNLIKNKPTLYDEK